MECVHPDKIVKARKDHQCGGCLGRIAKGATCKCSTWTDGGNIWQWRLCEWCQEQLKDGSIYDAFYCGPEGEAPEGGMREIDGIENLPEIFTRKPEATPCE